MPYLISIITVTKDCANTIGRTLDSISSIKASDIQYIIVDGESNDGTLKIIEQYGSLVDILISEPDTGIYNAMNKGAKLASGRYILFLNGDDYLLEDGFNKSKILLENNSLDILSCQSKVYEADGKVGQMLTPSTIRLYFYNSIPHLSTFVSLELQNRYEFREEFRIAADYDLFLRMYLKGHHFMLSNAVTSVHYRGGFSSDVEMAQAEITKIKRENLGLVLFFFVSVIERLNRLRKRII